MERKKQIAEIREDFMRAQTFLHVIGDETRQLILLVLMETDCHTGMRVGELTQKTHLSRPAVSHQLRVLKESRLVRVRREGTKNYYYIDVLHNRQLFGTIKMLSEDIEQLMNFLERQEEIRNGKNDQN